MKLFVRPGQEAPLNTREVRLGELGRGRVLAIIPVVGDGPEVVVESNPQGTVLCRAAAGTSDHCVVVLRADGEYRRGAAYTVPRVPGLTVLATGQTAWGDAGRIGTCEHVLAAVEPGCSVKLANMFGHIWHTWDGQMWLSESPPERRARLAAASAGAGAVGIA